LIVIAFLCIAGILGIVILPFWLIPAHPFPQPSGKWRVGIQELTWDSSSHQGIIAKVWYPTHAAEAESPYIDNIERTLSVMTTGLNPLIKLIFNGLYLGRVKTPAILNASLDRSAGAFPLLIFSPGFASINWVNTFYGLEFASHGFIVIGINHPGSSAAALLADGTPVKFNGIEKNLFANAERYDALLAEASSQQAKNISMVADRALALNANVNSFLHQMIDPSQIFAAGHSIGGAASFLACGQDRRIAKAINFDGAFIDGMDTDYRDKVLLLIHSDRDKYRPRNKTMGRQYDDLMKRDSLRIEQLATKANLQKIVWPLATHFNFADVALVIRPIFSQSIGLVGKTDGLDLLLKTAAVSMDFLGR
jgi:Platelet-activating factor acetylhydrolase, isoform II